MDEPCSALDPTSTRRIEETIAELSQQVTIVIVTHNMQQAQRVSQQCAFFLAAENEPGHIVEAGPDREDVLRARRPAHARLRPRPVRMKAADRRSSMSTNTGRVALGAVSFVLAIVGRGRPPRPRRPRADATINGAGSTWSAIAVDQWRADVARQGISVNYKGVGSTAGPRLLLPGPGRLRGVGDPVPGRVPRLRRAPSSTNEIAARRAPPVRVHARSSPAARRSCTTSTSTASG